MGETERPRVLAAALVVLVAGAVGVATSFLQTVLPHAVAPLANSAGSWCLVAWLLARRASSPARGAAYAVVALLALVAGYYAAADLRGFGVASTSVGVWVVAAALVGPPLGAGAVRSRTAPGWVRVLAALVLPALLVAEAAYGLLVVGSTTSTAYWVGEGAAGLVLGLLLLTRTPGRGRRHTGPRVAGARDHDPVSVR